MIQAVMAGLVVFLATSLSAEPNATPFAKEIEFQSAVFKETGLIEANKAFEETDASLDKGVADKMLTRQEAEKRKHEIRASFEKAVSSIVLGPDAPLEEAFKGFKGDDPERRFLLVVKEGAFIGLLPKKPSRTNRTENRFYFTLPIPGKPEYFLEYVSEGEKGSFSKVVSSDKKGYDLIEVVAIDPETVRNLVVEQLKGPLVIARHAYLKNGDKLVKGFPKELTREQYSKLLSVASQIKTSDAEFTRAVEEYKKELNK